MIRKVAVLCCHKPLLSGTGRDNLAGQGRQFGSVSDGGSGRPVRNRLCHREWTVRESGSAQESVIIARVSRCRTFCGAMISTAALDPGPSAQGQGRTRREAQTESLSVSRAVSARSGAARRPGCPAARSWARGAEQRRQRPRAGARLPGAGPGPSGGSKPPRRPTTQFKLK